MAGEDPWGVFGSDSEDDSMDPAAAPKPPPPPSSHGRAVKANIHQNKSKWPWEVLFPTFDGVPDSVLQNIPRASLADIVVEESGSADGRAAASNGRSVGMDDVVEQAPFSALPVYQHPAVRYKAGMAQRGGGRGFVACAEIAPGTLLLRERRFLPMPTSTDCGLAGGIAQEELCLEWILALPLPRLKIVLSELRWLHPQSLQDLPEEEKQDLLRRHEQTARGMVSKLGKEACSETGLNVCEIVRLFGALQSNGFASGIYLHPAMTNHSCRPNAIKWQGRKIRQPGGGGHGHTRDGVEDDSEEPVSEIRATELIRPGEEITLSYLEPREISCPSRQKRLKDQFGFDCSCRLCAASDGAAQPLEAFLLSSADPSQTRHVVGGQRQSGNILPEDDTSQEGTPSANEHPRTLTSDVPTVGAAAAAAACNGNVKDSLDRRAALLLSTAGSDERVLFNGGDDKLPSTRGEDSRLTCRRGDGKLASPGGEETKLSTPRAEMGLTVSPAGVPVQGAFMSDVGSSQREYGDEGVDGRLSTKDGEEEEDGNAGSEDAATYALVAQNVLERRLEAVESIINLVKNDEVRWHGVLTEVLTFRAKAAQVLGPRHIALARADKTISKACIAILQGSLGEAETDQECVEAVTVACNSLPISFGGQRSQSGRLGEGNARVAEGSELWRGAFKTRLLAVFVSALLSRRKTQLLYMGDSPHPEAGACFADLSQAMGMLMAQGGEGAEWIARLPGRDISNFRKHGVNCSSETLPGSSAKSCNGYDGDKEWWVDGGMIGASLFERECDKAARKIGRLYDDSSTYGLTGTF